MPRIRTIKPEFWTSEKLATSLPGADGRQARLLFIALWNFAEDHGVCRATPAYLRAQAFAYDEDVTAGDVARWLQLLVAGAFVVPFERGGCHYVWTRGWKEHQKIDRPSKPSLPEPSEQEMARTPEGSLMPRRGLDEGSLQERKGMEGRGEERSSGPPSASPAARADPSAKQVPLVDVPPTPRTNLAQAFVDFARAESKPKLAPDAPNNCVLQNGQWPRLGQALKDHGMLRLQAAFRLYLLDEYAQGEGFPLGLFIGQWEKWVGRVKAPTAGGAPKQSRAPAVPTEWTDEDVG